MNTKELLKIFQNKNNYPTIFLVFFDIILLCTVIFVGYKVYDFFQQVENAKNELVAAKSRATLIKNNQHVLSDNLVEYNKLLEQLIPETETYFQVVAALEQLEKNTGTTISSYRINLEETTEEKMSLTINISGSKDSLQNVLKNYRFVSGRLLTNETVSYSLENDESIAFTLNLFHKAFKGDTSDGSSVINQKDVQFLEDVKKKIM